MVLCGIVWCGGSVVWCSIMLCVVFGFRSYYARYASPSACGGALLMAAEMVTCEIIHVFVSCS